MNFGGYINRYVYSSEQVELGFQRAVNLQYYLCPIFFWGGKCIPPQTKLFTIDNFR